MQSFEDALSSLEFSLEPGDHPRPLVLEVEIRLKKAELEKQMRKLLDFSNIGADYDESAVIKNKMKLKMCMST